MPFAEENIHFYAEEVGPPPEHQDFRTAPPVIFSGGRKPFKLLYGELTIYGTSGNDELQLIHYTKYFGFDPSGEDDITKLVLNGRTYFFTDTSVRTIRISLGAEHATTRQHDRLSGTVRLTQADLVFGGAV